MNKLLKHLQNKYDVEDHIDLGDERQYVTLFLEFNNSHAEIAIIYTSDPDSIDVKSITYYEKDKPRIVSQADLDEIELELNSQLTY